MFNLIVFKKKNYRSGLGYFHHFSTYLIKSKMTWQGATVSGSVTRRRRLYLCGGIIGNLKKKALAG